MLHRPLTTVFLLPYCQSVVTMSSSCTVSDRAVSCRQTLPSPLHTSEFYRKVLPSNCIGFSSQEGKQVFREALQAGYMEAYFGLAAQFRTQDEPAFCGLSTLVMVLNTLEVDPLRLWKEPWRWYHENMLDCCVPLEIASTKGITMDEFACVAACNTLSVNMVRADNKATEDGFRSVVKKLSQVSDEVLVLSYSREVLGQTGDGHFSPIGGYHPERDLVLILDTARFKYPPHWVSLPLIFKAMTACDKDTGLPRGYVQLCRSDTVPLVLFRWADTLSLPMLDTDQVQEKQTGIMQFSKIWDEWLTQYSYNVEEGRVLKVAIEVLVKSLGMLEETVLTTQVDRCPEIISSEHHCVVKELLLSLESMPVFKAVSEYLLQNSERSELAQKAQKHAIGRTLCRMGQSSLRINPVEMADNTKDSVDSICQVELKSDHFITIILLSWPEVKCDNLLQNKLQREMEAQLCCTKPVLQNEVTQLKRQLSMLSQHREQCMHCHCNKHGRMG